MMSERPLRQASGTSFEFEDLPPPVLIPTKTITIEQPREKPLLNMVPIFGKTEEENSGEIKIGIFDSPPTPLFAKRALEFFAKEDSEENCLGMKAMRFPRNEEDLEIMEENQFSSNETSELEDSALGLEEISKSSDIRKPSKTSLNGIQQAVSQTVAERVFDLLKEYKAPKSEDVKEMKVADETQGNVLFERLVKKCFET